jgi:hypothetical protein
VPNRHFELAPPQCRLNLFYSCSHKSPFVFLIANIAAGAGISIYHIASSGHSLHRQDEVGRVIVPKLHGAWAVGAMSTAAIAFLISTQVSIAWHITTLMICIWILTQFSITKLSPSFPPKPDADDDYQTTSFKQFKFKINWFLSIGFFCASIMEFTIADWATLFGKEELGMGASVATLCYLVYLIGLIIGRYSIGWALQHQSERFWIKTGGVLGGVGFTSMLLLSTVIVDSNKNIAFAVAFLWIFTSRPWLISTLSYLLLNCRQVIKWQKCHCSCSIKFYEHIYYLYFQNYSGLGS